jgi:integrase
LKRQATRTGKPLHLDNFGVLGERAGDWHRALKGVSEEARIPVGNAHRFRDTFAVGLLQAGVPMDRVSMLLGHSSIKVTEKKYSPWVRTPQEQLEAVVRRAWDPPFPEAKRDSPGASKKERAVI